MLHNSLSHKHIKNQQNASWNDDPFELKGFFEGAPILNRQRNLSDYAQELVATYAKYSNSHYEISLDMIPEEELNELARLYIESIDREIEWACYGEDESINSSFLCSLLAMLKDNNKESRESFAETTRKNILIFYKESLDSLIQIACEEYFNTIANEEEYEQFY